jgi:drug/metabolite transporter (DMT)-like permease
MKYTALGALMLSGSLLAFAIQDAVVKLLSDQYAVLQILTIRIIFVLAFVLGFCVLRYGVSSLRTRHYKILLLRGLLAFLAFTTYYLALAVTPMASVAAVYMSAPLFVTALSALLLKEKVGIHRWLSVVVGFAAVLLIINPTAETFRIESALPLLSALFYSMLPIITRHVGQQVNALVMATYNSISYLVLCVLAVGIISTIPVEANSPPLLLSITQSWSMPSTEDILWMAFTGAFFTAGVLSITQAYRISNVSAIAPFEYTLLVWTALIGYVVFAEVPTFRTIIGAIVIVACGVYILYRESAIKKASVLSQQPSQKPRAAQ